MEQRLLELERHLVATETQAAPFLWVAPAFGWVPRYGATIGQAPQLLDIAIEGAGAGHDAIVAAAPVIEAMQGEGDRLARFASSPCRSRPGARAGRAAHG